MKNKKKFKTFPKVTRLGKAKEIIEINNLQSFVGTTNKEEFYITPKYHGTNTAVGLNIETGEMWIQSREKAYEIDDEENKVSGFRHFVAERKQLLKDFLYKVYEDERGWFPGNIKEVVVYGEWVGPKIQKNVALNELEEKHWLMFAYRLVLHKERFSSPVFTAIQELKKGNYPTKEDWNLLKENNIHTASSPPTAIPKSIMLGLEDFEKDSGIYKKLEEYAKMIEEECPFSKEMGISGTGEGIVLFPTSWASGGKDVDVWSEEYQEFWPPIFKVKGSKHKVVKEKAVEEGVDAIKSPKDFVDFTCTAQRIEQGVERVLDFSAPTTKEEVEAVTQWVLKDIKDEEWDIVTKKMFSEKMTEKLIVMRVKKYFK